MPEFILLMHNDSLTPETDADWQAYIERLAASGHFRGGSSIGEGAVVRKTGAAAAISPVSGFLRIEARDLDEARTLLRGNPGFEAGASVEIRALPTD